MHLHGRLNWQKCLYWNLYNLIYLFFPTFYTPFWTELFLPFPSFLVKDEEMGCRKKKVEQYFPFLYGGAERSGPSVIVEQAHGWLLLPAPPYHLPAPPYSRQIYHLTLFKIFHIPLYPLPPLLSFFLNFASTQRHCTPFAHHHCVPFHDGCTSPSTSTSTLSACISVADLLPSHLGCLVHHHSPFTVGENRTYNLQIPSFWHPFKQLKGR